MTCWLHCAPQVCCRLEALPPGKRSFLVRRIDEAARVETRARRIQEGVEAAHERREKLKTVR